MEGPETQLTFRFHLHCYPFSVTVFNLDDQQNNEEARSESVGQFPSWGCLRRCWFQAADVTSGGVTGG